MKNGPPLKAVRTEELQRLDQQVTDLRSLKLSPAALSAALAAIEREREEIREAATTKVGDRQIRADRLLPRVPAIVDECRKQIENGLEVLSDARNVTAAREAVRKLLEDGTITLTPDAEQSALTGVIRFVDLWHHVLEQAGIRRRVGSPRAGDPLCNGRGDRI